MRSDIVLGGIFPNYELPDQTGTLRKLSELQGEDPLILTLARGHYCPKEHQQHLELAAFYPRIAVAYTQIATISTDDHHTLQEFRASLGAEWTFLSDPERTIQKDLDIQEYTDPEHNPMIPHTLVLKPGLVIRPGPSYTVDTLEELHRRLPDAELALVLGADCLPELTTWRAPERIERLAEIVLVPRPGITAPEEQTATPIRIGTIVEMPLVDISSHDIRQRVSARRSIRYLVPRAVECYIETHSLYRSE